MENSIGKILIEEKVITNQELELALSLQKKNPGMPLGQVFSTMMGLKEDEIVKAYASSVGTKYVDLAGIDQISVNLLHLNRKFLLKYKIFPFKEKKEKIFFAIGNHPEENKWVDDFQLITGKKVVLHLSTYQHILEKIKFFYFHKSEKNVELEYFGNKIPTSVFDYPNTYTNAEPSDENDPLEESLQGNEEVDYNEDEILYYNQSMVDIVNRALKVAKTSAAILLQGETGTGKEVITNLIHEASLQNKQNLVKINCAAIPRDLFESELFGYEKGAFTGAVREKQGILDKAHNGTVFLDEIGELSLELQTKLLRVLEERIYYRVGGMKAIEFNARLISASNRDLEKDVEEGKFRQDLFYRLSVISLRIPPLRKRRDEIPFLADYFIKMFNKKNKKHIRYISPSAMDHLFYYNWPGNIRELKNCVEQAVILAENDTITIKELPTRVISKIEKIRNSLKEHGEEESKDGETEPTSATDLSHNFFVDEGLEEKKIIEALKKSRFRRNEAARLLGIHRNTLLRKIKKYKISI